MLFEFGYDGGPGSHDNFIYCSTVPNGGGTPSGVLNAKQTAIVGNPCSGHPDDWVDLVGQVINDIPATGYGIAFIGLVYDTVNKKAIKFGGTDSGLSSIYNDTWTFNVPTLTWTHQTPTGGPPPAAPQTVVHAQPAVAYVGSSGLLYYHDITTPSDWTYNYATNTWTNLGNNGGPTATETISWSPSTNSLISYENIGSNQAAIDVGSLGAVINVPLTIQEAIYPGSISGINRTNLSRHLRGSFNERFQWCLEYFGPLPLGGYERTIPRPWLLERESDRNPSDFL